MGVQEYCEQRAHCTVHILTSTMRTAIFISLLCLDLSMAQVLEGLLPLDMISFDKVVSKFEYSSIKFDTGYPTGDKHKTFGKLAVEVAGIADVFVGEVRIQDYGDKKNKDLAERLGVDPDKKKLPETVLFSSTDGVVREVVRYGGDYSIDNLRSFITGKTGVYIKCDGCIKELDILAEKFARAANKEDREKILFAAESWAVEKEIARVEKMLENKSSDNVKQKLSRRRNVLNS